MAYSGRDRFLFSAFGTGEHLFGTVCSHDKHSQREGVPLPVVVDRCTRSCESGFGPLYYSRADVPLLPSQSCSSHSSGYSLLN